MKEIVTESGHRFKVDDENFDLLSMVNWVADKAGDGRFYAVCFTKRKKTYMHRLIANPGPGQEVDHKDGDTQNNQEDNLRVCTHQQNTANSKKKGGRSSKYKGVYFDKAWKDGRWRAQITANYRVIKLGAFSTEEEAARAYDEAAREHFGEFARTNF